MKKILVALLLVVVTATAMLVAVSAASSGGFQVGTVKSFTLSGDTNYISTTTSKDADAINALKALLASATSSAKKPANGETVATVKVDGDKSYTFQLVRSGSEYLLAQESQYRKVRYDDFNTLVNTLGSKNVYKYSSLPVLTLATEDGEVRLDGGASGIEEGSYQYRRMSGKFNTVKMPATNAMSQLHTKTGKVYIPTFDSKPDAVSVKIITMGGVLVWEGTAAQAANYTLPTKDSAYDVYFYATADNAYYKFDITYSYRLGYDDNIIFSVDGDNTYLGEAVVFRVSGGKTGALATYTTNLQFSIPPKFFLESDGSQVMYFPVSYNNAAGEHWVELSLEGEKVRYTINAKDKQWQRQDLEVSESTAEETILSQRANEEYERVIAPLRSVMDDKKYASGRFILPVSDEKVTTQFGMVRYTNGQPTSTRHGAIDLAVPRGTPVKATGAGRVLYAGYLQLTGNTVLVEHGFGLKSWYYHMDSLSVSTGDMIAQSQVIGTVGSTGFSTGPHLHFGMSVNNVFINPYTAINTDLLA